MHPRLQVLIDSVLAAGVALTLVLGVLWFWTPVRVGGESMRPALHVGDVAIVARSSTARRGDIALLHVPGHGAVLHRIVGVRDDGAVRTKGDANEVADRDPVPASAVSGRVVAVVPVGLLLERWRQFGACDTMTAQQNSAKQ